MHPSSTFHLLITFLTLWNISILYVRASLHHHHDHPHHHQDPQEAFQSWKKRTMDLNAIEEQWLQDDWDEEDDMSIDEQIYMESNQRRDEAMKRLDQLMMTTNNNNNDDDGGGGNNGDIGDNGDGGRSTRRNEYNDFDAQSGIQDQFVKAAREAEISGKASMIFAKLDREFMFSRLEANTGTGTGTGTNNRNIDDMARRGEGEGEGESGDKSNAGGTRTDHRRENNAIDGSLPVLSWDDLAQICNEWQSELSWAVIESSCFPVEPDSLLFTTKRGWEGEDVWRYLSNRKEVGEATWNDRKMYPAEFFQDEYTYT